MMYRRKRKIILEPLKTDNTPFKLMARDICEIVLDILDTRTIFNLMLVSKNTKAICYNEHHWKKRLHLLFRDEEIENHLYLTRHDEHANVPYRIVAVEIIKLRRTINRQQFEIRLSNLSDLTITVSDQAMMAFNATIGKYVEDLSLDLRSNVINRTLADFPLVFSTMGVKLGHRYFIEDVNKTNLGPQFVILLLVKVIRNMYFRTYDLVINDRMLILSIVELMVYTQEKLAKSSKGTSPFVTFMQAYVNSEKYPWLAIECDKIGLYERARRFDLIEPL